jgi:nicotinamidase-related amidase
LNEKTIIEEWQDVKTLPPPEINDVIIEPKSTALLILDLQNRNCDQERRPRCVKQLPKIKQLLSKARKNDLFVVYALIRSSTKEDIHEEVAPIGHEPVVASSVDKFYNTDLEQLLKEKNIESVIIVGTSAHGAVLHTCTGAATRQLKVIVPVDGLSASDAYAEQYTVWHLANAPGTRRSVTLTKIDMIKFPK